MDREQARQYVRGQLQEYLRGRGIDPGKAFTCLSGTHADKKPSMHYDKEREQVHCFSCGARYDTFDLIGIERGLTNAGEIFRAAYEHFGIQVDGQNADRSPTAHTGGKTIPQTPAGEAAGSHGAVKGIDGGRQEQEPDYTEQYSAWHECLPDTDYLQRRGISAATAQRFLIGFCPCWRHPKAPKSPVSPRLIIPTGKGSYLARDIRPDADIPEAAKPYTKSKVGKARIFNASALRTATRPIFVTEGEIDALSIIEVGGEAIALGSVSCTRALLTLLQGQRLQQPLIVAMDNDAAGRAAAEKLLPGIQALGIAAHTLPGELLDIAAGEEQESGAIKDANALLQCNRGALASLIQDFEEQAKTHALTGGAGIEQNPAKEVEATLLSDGDGGGEAAEQAAREAYAEKSNYSYLQTYLDGIRNETGAGCYPTGFATLDAALGDGIFPGLYILGAIPSLGKTTFALQIADQIATVKSRGGEDGQSIYGTGRDVLFVSLEQSRSELIAKSLSRYTYVLEQQGYIDGGSYLREAGKHAYARTARDIMTRARLCSMTDRQLQLLDGAQAEYSKAARYVYIQQGITPGGGLGQIRGFVAAHLAATGEAPVLIVDYLQMLSIEAGCNTEKQNIDATVRELKEISRDFNTPVIVISSFNRAGYRDGAAMEQFKESGGIEYSADVLMTLQFVEITNKYKLLEELRKENPRKLELVILKNRNGSTDEAPKFDFYPMFNYFREHAPFDNARDIDF